ncbi:unnamed protein product [Ilex paraguariensis]|uniref:Uncharacterized protein n=1 Tax=Ilex paraguariensis TaxID=185542 RepID=A0ABC8T5E1_9AQUA
MPPLLPFTTVDNKDPRRRDCPLRDIPVWRRGILQPSAPSGEENLLGGGLVCSD